MSTASPAGRPERRTAASITDAEAVLREGRETPQARRPFDPRPYIISIQGKEYLPVRPRVMWLRHDHGTDWGIATEMLYPGERPNVVVVRASVEDEAGRVVATGLAEAPLTGKFPALMKAETAAIGRALAHAGYGTDWAEDEDDVVDDPVAPNAGPPPAPAGPLMIFRPLPQDNAELTKQMSYDLETVFAAGTSAHLDQWVKHYAKAPKEAKDAVRSAYEETKKVLAATGGTRS